MQPWELTFNALVDTLLSSLPADEHCKLTLTAEDSHFTRFNQARVRQTGTVTKGLLTLALMAKQRIVKVSCPFTGQLETDESVLMAVLPELRRDLQQVPADPYLVQPQGNAQSRYHYPGQLPAAEAVVPHLLPPLQGCDAAGLYAGGSSVRAYADSAGQRHWFETATFTVDYSIFSATGQAVKGTYAGRTWEDAAYLKTLAASKRLLAEMEQTPKGVDRGHYRTYLAPAAVADLVNMLSWQAIGEASIRRGGSPLGLLQRQARVLSPQVALTEDFSQGQVPAFNQFGELAPQELSLIASGQLVNTLVSARTAKEYNIPSTYAEPWEGLRSPRLHPGRLATQEALEALDTGLYVSNLHYLNWSDRTNGRITGMTRYACFWVENGKIIAPIENLRFDESLYHFWGEGLLELTQETTFIPEVGSYGFRDLGGTTVPGMLVDNFAYTL